MEPEDLLHNQCGALVEQARYEPAMTHLLKTRRAGEWVPVAELYRAAGAFVPDLRPEAVATWLPSPSDPTGYAVVLFCDEDLQWSTTAFYNVARLLNRTSDMAAVPDPVR